MIEEEAQELFFQLRLASMDGISPEISVEHFIKWLYENGYKLEKQNA